MNMANKNLNQTSMRRVGKNESGFSLLELMVAICILGVGLLVIATMQIGSINASSDANGVSEATTLAALQMEALFSLPYRSNQADDDKNHTDLRETSFVADPSDASALGLYNPFPDDRAIFDPQNIDLLNPANNTYPPDHWRIEDRYTIMWNISTDAEMENTKTVQVVVAWNDSGTGRFVSVLRVIPRII